MSLRQTCCGLLLAIVGLLATQQTVYAVGRVWSGTDGDLGNAANWGGTVPTTTDEAQFTFQGTNPTTGNLSPRFIGYYGPGTTGQNTIPYNIGGGTITIPTNGNIDLDDANADQIISPTTLTLNGAAQILTSAGSTNKLTLSPGTFNLNSGTVTASTGPFFISPTTFNVANTGTTVLNANGSNITVTPATSFVTATRQLQLKGGSTVSLNGGLGGTAGTLVNLMGSTGTLNIGSSGAWGGQVQLGSGNSTINTNYGNIQISTADALGVGGNASAGYTDLGPSKSGAIVVNNPGSPISIPEYVFVRGRDNVANAQIVNAAGNNTFTGMFQSDTATGSGTNVTFRSDAGNLGFSGSIVQMFTSPLTLNLAGASTGNISGNISETASSWSVAKVDAGTWTLSGPNTYTGTTTVNGGTLVVNGSHNGGGAYSVNSGGTLAGSGTINTAGNASATVVAGGMLAPGGISNVLHMNLGTGTLDVSGAVAATNSQSMLFTLDTPATSSMLQLTSSSSTLTIGTGALEFDDFKFTTTGSFGPGTYVLFDTSAAIVGSLGSHLSGVVGGFAASVTLADSGHDVVLTVVPEPSTCLLAACAALGLMVCGRRKHVNAGAK